MDDKRVVGEVVRIVHARRMGEDKILAGLLLEQAGNLDGADVVFLPVVRAAFGDEDAVAVA